VKGSNYCPHYSADETRQQYSYSSGRVRSNLSFSTTNICIAVGLPTPRRFSRLSATVRRGKRLTAIRVNRLNVEIGRNSEIRKRPCLLYFGSEHAVRANCEKPECRPKSPVYERFLNNSRIMQPELPSAATASYDRFWRLEVRLSDDDLFKCLLSELDLCGE
jgi:hypothetical protein